MKNPNFKKLSYDIRNKCVRKLSGRIDRKLFGNGNDFWLFVLGVNNSGTTVLSNILESHSEIRSLPREGQLLTSAFPQPGQLGVGRLWTKRIDVFRWTEKDDPYPALKAKKDWINNYAPGEGILLEKSPPNTIRSRWLQKNFHPSRFLSIFRNPYAVCEGIKRRQNYTIEEAAQHWLKANSYLLSDVDRLSFSKVIYYEDLVSCPQECLSGIEKFLELNSSFDPEMYLNVTAHSVEGETTGLQNLNDASFRRLTPEDVSTINEICGELMGRLGYVPE